MDSLYGGRPGTSFILSASFKSVDEMIEAFSRGPNYTEVWYNCYCIIDTPNKNDETNGQIYQRGLDYNGVDANGKPTGGAIYIGQIVGPSSGTPYMQLNTIPEVEKHTTETLGKYDYRRYPTGYKYENGEIVGYTTSDGSDGAPLAQFDFSKAHDTSLVPGKYIDGQDTDGNDIVKYRDEIKWTWCNIRKDNEDSDSWFYVGFEIPYLITDYSIHMVSPYDEQGNLLVDSTEIERIDDQTHPFYSHWDLGIPKGIKGDAIRNLRVIVPTEADNICDISALGIDPISGEATVDTSMQYAGKDDDVAAQRQIVVFDYYIFDKLRNPVPYTFYVGDFNIITDIKVEDDGTLVVSYTHEDDSVFIQKIRWIDQIELTEGNGTQGGHFTFTYNVDVDPDAEDLVKETKEFDVSWIKGLVIETDGSIVYTYAGTPSELPENAVDLTGGKYRVDDFLQWIGSVNLDAITGIFQVFNNRNEEIFNTQLDWIRDIIIDEDGTIHFIHTDTSIGNNGDYISNTKLKYVTSVELNPANGKFTMNFNTGTNDTYTSQLDWIDDLYINEANGEIAIHHVFDTNNTSAATAERPAAEVLDARLKLITRAEISRTGVLTFYTNTNEQFNLLNLGTNSAFQLKYVENVHLNTGIKDDKHIGIKYNTSDKVELLGDPINYIQDMVVRTTDWHLLVLFNDPEHRFVPSETNQLDNNGKDVNGIVWVNNITGSTGTTYSADVYWRDYGTIKDQAGVLIGLNVTKNDLDNAGYTDILNYLNDTYPGGLKDTNNTPYGMSIAGKIVTYAENITDEKSFYAYDYNRHEWFYLGKISDTGMRDIKFAIDVNSYAQVLELMEKVNNDGILLVANNVTYQDSTKPVPLFWDASYNDWPN